MVQELGGRGVDTDKHFAVRLSYNKIQYDQQERLKKHYGFKSNEELYTALIRRAVMHLDTGK